MVAASQVGRELAQGALKGWASQPRAEGLVRAWQDQDHLFVIGTEEGHIHKCSTASNSEVLFSYEGHAAAVHGLQWNSINTNIFLSASADWSVRLWDASVRAVCFLTSPASSLFPDRLARL